MWIKVFAQTSIGIMIIVSAGIAGIYYVAKYDNGQSIKNEISSLDKQKTDVEKGIKNLELELQGIQEVEKVINVMGDKMNEFLKFIPDKMTSSMILNHLNVNAKSAGVELSDIANHDVVAKEEFYEKIKINITVRGVFTQVLVFLSKLTGLTEIVTIESFVLKEISHKKELEDEVQMQMEIYGYRYITPIVDTNSINKGVKK